MQIGPLEVNSSGLDAAQASTRRQFHESNGDLTVARALPLGCHHGERGLFAAVIARELDVRQRRASRIALAGRARDLALIDGETEIESAINADFGVRSAEETRLLELWPVREAILGAISHVGKWMRPQKRSVDWLIFPGAKNRVIPQPLGVVGVIVPWNFPIQLSFGPLVDILAAGNHAMVKMSEKSVNLARLLVELSPRYLSPEKLTFFECGGRGPAFSTLPFDHLIFTGSSATGRAAPPAARSISQLSAVSWSWSEISA